MKRKFTKRFDRLYSMFPLFFWYQCNKCKKEFRREKGWRALDLPVKNHMHTVYHLCNSCAPTRKIADEYFLSKKHLKDFRSKRPTTPPQTE